MKQQKGTHQPSEEPFEALIAHHKGMLFRLCHRYCGREATAEDLMQEMTLALWRNIERLRAIPEDYKRKVWVWRVAHNAAVDYLRRSPGHQELEASMTTELRTDDNPLVEQLRELIEQLSEPDRTIVQMQLAGYSYEEIGKQVGISTKNVSVRLVRAKESLRNQIKRSI